MDEQTELKSRREEHREQTRAALLEAGRAIFADVGFGAAGTEAIARKARVTRGAFYHHFEDKLALFDAVVVSLCAEAAAKIEKKVGKKSDLWESLFAGITVYLDECTEPDYSIIVIQNAPAILGEKRYRDIDESHAAGLLATNIEALIAAGKINCDDPTLLSRMINAMICKVAVLLPSQRNSKALKADAVLMIERCLTAFRPN
ncbi:MAG: TetR family transcriptional regulator [Hyphococcus sp.]|nr:MAG: TetR family transcriptional regulator [Marinicaulis sp.]